MPSKPDERSLHLECPACSIRNSISSQRDIVCGKCKKSLLQTCYTKVTDGSIVGTIVVTAVVAGVGGVGGAYLFEQATEPKRHSIEVEYAIVDHCINGDIAPLPRYFFPKKRDYCICVLKHIEKTGALSKLFPKGANQASEGGRAAIDHLLMSSDEECSAKLSF